MYPARRFAKSRPSSIVIATLLAVALLCSQWMGLAHRIAHAGTAQQQNFSVIWSDSQADGKSDSDARHSCAAFDAATLSDTVTPLPFIAPLLTSTRVLALWVAFASWDATLARYFSPRAPPFA